VDSSRPRVELFLNDENVYAHRKGDKPQGQFRTEHVPDNASQMNSQIQTLTQPKDKKRAVTKPLSESDDDSVPARASRDKPPSRFGSVLRRNGTAVRAEKVTKKRPLFLDSDDEENHEVNAMDIDPTCDEEEQTLQSSLETRQTVKRQSTRVRKSGKPAPIVVDDDSDDDAVFKGFKGQKKGR